MSSAVVVIAAHPDDEVLGCGGTMARYARDGRPVHVLLFADGESSRTGGEAPDDFGDQVDARNRAAAVACRVLGCATVTVLALPDNRLDGVELLDLVKHVESFVVKHRPATVLTHHAGDVNIDHRMLHEAVVAACRPQPNHPVRELLFFEIASSTEWRPAGSGIAFVPN